jgi:hypothetical protein
MCSLSSGGGCFTWWSERSYADARTRRVCDDQHAHAEHLWNRADEQPPLPFTMWVCAGRAACAPEVAG